MQGYPIKSIFEVYCGNLAVTSLCDRVWELMKRRTNLDDVLENSVNLQLCYVTSMAFVYRLVSCAPFKGGSDVYHLKEATRYIQLPDCLCEYIEAVGELTLENGLKITPWVDNPDKLYSLPGFISPIELLKQANRPVPNNPWGIDTDWILAWNTLSWRFERCTHFRVPDYKKPGSITQLVTAARDRCGLTPVSMQNMSLDEFYLGAAYRFRDWDHKDEWPGDTLKFMSKVFKGYNPLTYNPLLNWSLKIMSGFHFVSDSSDDD